MATKNKHLKQSVFLPQLRLLNVLQTEVNNNKKSAITYYYTAAAVTHNYQLYSQVLQPSQNS